MVGADDLIAIGNIGARSQKQCSVIAQIIPEPQIAVGHHLHMFRSDPIRFDQHLRMAVADNDFAKIGPGGPSNFTRRQNGQQPLDFRHGIACQLF